MWLIIWNSPEIKTSTSLIFLKPIVTRIIVLAGLLAATFSSALASFVGAPRILEALGNHSIVPFSGWLARRTKKHEPLNATLCNLLLFSPGCQQPGYAG